MIWSRRWYSTVLFLWKQEDPESMHSYDGKTYFYVSKITLYQEHGIISWKEMLVREQFSDWIGDSQSMKNTISTLRKKVFVCFQLEAHHCVVSKPYLTAGKIEYDRSICYKTTLKSIQCLSSAAHISCVHCH